MKDQLLLQYAEYIQSFVESERGKLISPRSDVAVQQKPRRAADL
jgi:hypothetical protein